jgi:hypothetical protein
MATLDFGDLGGPWDQEERAKNSGIDRQPKHPAKMTPP